MDGNEKQSDLTMNHSKYNAHKWEKYLNSASGRLNSDTDMYSCYKEKFIEFMQEYAELHRDELQDAHKCYEKAISSDFIADSYELLDESKLKQVLSQCKVMVITANPIEKAVLHSCIKKENKPSKTGGIRGFRKVRAG